MAGIVILVPALIVTLNRMTSPETMSGLLFAGCFLSRVRRSCTTYWTHQVLKGTSGVSAW